MAERRPSAGSSALNDVAQQELGTKYSMQGRTQVAPRVQTMQNARPTVRSALSNLMRDAVDATGLVGGYRQGLLNAAEGVETAADFLPVVGDVLGLEDASRAYGQGDMVGTGINMMGVVPIIGDAGVKLAKKTRSALRDSGFTEGFFHGTKQDIQDGFKAGYNDGMVFVSPNKEFASNWIGKGKYQDRIGEEDLYDMRQADKQAVWDDLTSQYGDFDNWPEEIVDEYFAKQSAIVRQYEASGGAIYPVAVKANNQFDPESNPEIISEFLARRGQDPLGTTLERGKTDLEVYQEGNYLLFENKEMADFLKEKGYDSLWLREDTTKRGLAKPFSTLAVLDETGVKPVYDFAREADTSASALRAIDAYHGSPHEFERFSMDKIGTGEGAQAYGNGLYFAEQKSVGGGYRDALSRGKLIDGQIVSENLANEIPYDRSRNIDANRLNRVIKEREYALSSRDSYERELEYWKRYKTDLGTEAGPMPEYLASKDSWDAEIANEAQKLELLKKVQSDPLSVSDVEGRLYNVNLNVQPDELLDYDAILEDQPAAVLNKLRQTDWFEYAEEALDLNLDDNPTGGDLLRWLSEDYDPQEVSELLSGVGIKGTRYLDGTSRKAGEGTRNYVMFDDSLIDIKRVNDKLTPSWMDQGARMQRAQDLEFDTSRPLYHYTDKLEDGAEITSLLPSPADAQTKLGRGIYTSPQRQYGDRHVRKDKDDAKAYNENARVIPVYARGKLATGDEYETAYRAARESIGITGDKRIVDTETKLKIRSDIQSKTQEILKQEGFKGVQFMDEVMIFDPKDVRSINAEFDPTKADSADLLSSRQSERQMSALRGIA